MKTMTSMLALAFLIAALVSTGGGEIFAQTNEPAVESTGGFDARALREQITELRNYLDDADQRLTENRDRVQEEIEAANNAVEIIDETIESLNEMVTRFESSGDIRQQMVAAEEFARGKSQEYGGSSSSALQNIAPRFQEMAQIFLGQQYSAEEMVDQAMTQIRRLEENREGAIALLELGALQEARALLQDSLTQFGEVIDNTRQVADGLEEATTQYGAF